MIKEIRRKDSVLTLITDTDIKEIDLEYKVETAAIFNQQLVIVLLSTMTTKVLARTPDGKSDYIRTDVCWANRNIKAVDETGKIVWQIEDTGDTNPLLIVKVPQRYYFLKLQNDFLYCTGGHADFEIDPQTGKVLRRIEKRRLKKLDDSCRHEIKNPSEDFKQFVNQYFNDFQTWIRGEEDPDLPAKLKGEELACAIKLLMGNIHSERIHILSALRRLEVYEAVGPIKNLLSSTSNENFKIEASYLLHKWIGEPGSEEFYSLCEKGMGGLSSFTKNDILYYAKEFDEKRALKLFWKGLNDMDFSVRAAAFWNLRIYFGVQSTDIMKVDPEYYPEMVACVSDDVFDNKALLEEKLSDLKKKIKKWKRKKC